MTDEPIGFMREDPSGENWRMTVAFDRDSWDFVLGVEVGMIYAETEMISEGIMPGYSRAIHPENVEMVMRICEAKGIRFSAEQPEDDGWIILRLGDEA